METSALIKPLACKLTSPELKKRKDEVISQLKTLVIERIELVDGYSYRFDGTDETIDSVTAFIKSERLCCEFFSFKLVVSSERVAWLDITGPDGAKQFIVSELGM